MYYKPKMIVSVVISHGGGFIIDKIQYFYKKPMATPIIMMQTSALPVNAKRSCSIFV